METAWRSWIYLVPVDQSFECQRLTLPPDAGWIFTAPDRSVDAVAEHIGDASDRPVQVIGALGEGKIRSQKLVEVIDACVRTGPNPVLVVSAHLAESVRQLARSEQVGVRDLGAA